MHHTGYIYQGKEIGARHLIWHLEAEERDNKPLQREIEIVHIKNGIKTCLAISGAASLIPEFLIFFASTYESVDLAPQKVGGYFVLCITPTLAFEGIAWLVNRTKRKHMHRIVELFNQPL